jgi:hypothetical protein
LFSLDAIKDRNEIKRLREELQRKELAVTAFQEKAGKGFGFLLCISLLLITLDFFLISSLELTLALQEKKQKDQENTILKEEISRLTLGGVRADPNSTLPLPPPDRNAMMRVPLASELASHAFLTHAWGSPTDNFENHRRVGKIYSELKKRYNMKMWFDQDYIQGNILDKIVEGLNHTKCMLVFLTKQYDIKINDEKEGKFCKLEFDCAVVKFGHDRLIPVIMEEEMLTPANWSLKVFTVFGSTKYLDFTKLTEMDENTLSEKCEELFQLVMKRTS